MKFTVATTALMATSVMAAPKPEPWCDRPGQPCWKREALPEPVAAPEAKAEAEPWCYRPGQPCWKAKRSAEAEADPWCYRPGQPCWKRAAAADAFAEAIVTSGGIKARTPEADYSNAPGGAAFVAKRQINELAALIALAEADPAGFYSGLGLQNEFGPDTVPEHTEPENTETAESTDDTKKEKRDASPWCYRPGQPCWKRDALPEPVAAPDAEAEAEPEAWCDRPGQPCWKVKRAEEHDKRWCYRPGQPCWKAKRAAEAVLEAVAAPDAEAFETKPFNPAYFAKREAEPWCYRPGQPCWKRDAKPEAEADPEPWCMRPGASCWAAKRDIQAMATVARSIIAAAE